MAIHTELNALGHKVFFPGSSDSFVVVPVAPCLPVPVYNRLVLVANNWDMELDTVVSMLIKGTIDTETREYIQLGTVPSMGPIE